MNAKPILLALLACGCAVGIAGTAAQDLIEYPLQAGNVQVIPPDPAKLGLEFDCTLTFKEGGRNSPVKVKGASFEEAQRNAVALATPTGANCALAGLKSSN